MKTIKRAPGAGRKRLDKISVNLRLDAEVAEWLKKRVNKSAFVNQMLLNAMNKEHVWAEQK